MRSHPGIKTIAPVPTIRGQGLVTVVVSRADQSMSIWDVISDGASSLWDGATSVVSDAAGAIGDAASGAYHLAADAATSVYDAGLSVANTASDYLHEGEEAVMSGAHWVEDEIDAGTHALAGYVKDVPVLGTVAEGVADATTFAAQVGGGLLGGATSLVGGVANAALHPIETARGLETMAEHAPIIGQGFKLGHGLLDVATGDTSLGDVMDRTFNPLHGLEEDAKYWGGVGSAMLDPYRKSMAEGRPGEVGGRGVFDIAMLLSGVGEAEGAATAGKAASAAPVAEATEMAKAAEAADTVRMAEGAQAARGGEAARGAAELSGEARAGKAADILDQAGTPAATHPSGTPEEYVRKAPYDPRKWRDHFDEQYPGQVESATVPPKNAKNVSLAGQRHPRTGVVFDDRGFPIFDDIAEYQTRLPPEIADLESSGAHMRAATRDLAKSVEGGGAQASRFTDEQLAAIRAGDEQIPGLTWHHHQERGRMLAVDEDFHARTGHVGGQQTWSSRKK